MTRIAFFVAGFALASLAPSIVSECSHPRESAPAARDDDKTEDKAEAAARKKKKIEELQVAMNQKEVSERTLDATMETFTEMGLPDSFQTCFRERFDLDRVIGFAVDVYAEHLEESTVDALIAFYKSDEGKTFTKALPDITVDTIKKGAEYGKQIGTECAQGR